MGAKGIGIVVGGPPNSGKSTFSVCLARALQDQGLDAHGEDFDLWAPTMAFLEGKITEEQRNEQKRKNVTAGEARRSARLFARLLNEHAVVIGDGPGGISKESEIIFKTARWGIIVCRDDAQNKVQEWVNFFDGIGVQIVGIVVSKLHGDEKVEHDSVIRADIVGLSREDVRVTGSVRVFASLLRSKLGV